MKKIFGVIIIALLFITVFTTCNQFQNDKNQIKDVPTMLIKYTIDGKTKEVSVNRGTSSWNFKDESVETDGLHPLDSVGYMPEIKKTDGLNDIIISFSSIPTSYTVRSWEDNCIGNEEVYEKDYKIIEYANDTIIIPKDKLGYIYEIHATWPQGNAYYAFYITSEKANVEVKDEASSDDQENISANQIFSILSKDGNTNVNVETTLDYFMNLFVFNDIMTVFEENNNKKEFNNLHQNAPKSEG